MSASPQSAPWRVTVKADGDLLLDVTLGGTWRLANGLPDWEALVAGHQPARLRLRTENLDTWDTSFLLFVAEAQEWADARGLPCDLESLPERVRVLMTQMIAVHPAPERPDHSQSLVVCVGLAANAFFTNLGQIFSFVGECVYGVGRTLRKPGKFRWRDSVDQMQQCGAMGLPIVSLISFLVGLTLAYQAAVELRQFGGDIYVADLVGISTVREMGPMMAAIILAGRTGAAFAATLGNMKANEEIDALETLGLSAVDFLVLPRLLALGLMMPLLALYANCVGILGGMVVAAGILQIPPSLYWAETQTAIDLSDLNSGLIKAVTFGLLIGLAGCLRGLQANRSAEGVGRAATSAVVTAILLIIVADSIYAVIFQLLGI